MPLPGGLRLALCASHFACGSQPQTLPPPSVNVQSRGIHSVPLQPPIRDDDGVRGIIRALAMPVRVTVWNENRVDVLDDRVRAIYPRGMHGAIAEALVAPGLTVRVATFDEPHHGLSRAVLDETDVLVFWAHAAHDELPDSIAEQIVARVEAGMGFVALHSAHLSKPFRLLMGTSCSLQWRVDGGREVLWVIEPSHPIAAGLPACIEIGEEEMYGERFDVPAPDALVLISSFPAGGEVFRSGCCYQRGAGRVFYFRPGHETYPTYHHPLVQRVILNAVRWTSSR